MGDAMTAVVAGSSPDDIQLTGEFEIVDQTTDVRATSPFFSAVEVS